MNSGPQITETQRQKEVSLIRAIWLDTLCLTLVVLAALFSGSLTVLAEVLRGSLMYSVEFVSLITLWRAHRGKYIEFEYGIGKIERVVTIIIAGGMFVSALWTFLSGMDRIVNPTFLATPAMIFAVVVASFNMAVNFYCTGDFIQSNEVEASLVLEGQIQLRTVKSMASVIVVVVLVTATWLVDPRSAALVDAIGGFLAAGYMVWIGTNLVRESLPDLMDRALPENEQLLILRVMAQHFEEFDLLDTVRSRRSGGKAFIDMDLEFESSMPMHEVDRRCKSIQEALVELIPDAIVTVTPRSGPVHEAG